MKSIWKYRLRNGGHFSRGRWVNAWEHIRYSCPFSPLSSCYISCCRTVNAAIISPLYSESLAGTCLYGVNHMNTWWDKLLNLHIEISTTWRFSWTAFEQYFLSTEQDFHIHLHYKRYYKGVVWKVLENHSFINYVLRVMITTLHRDSREQCIVLC